MNATNETEHQNKKADAPTEVREQHIPTRMDQPAKAAQDAFAVLADLMAESLVQLVATHAAELERVKVAMMTTEAVRLQETRRAIKAEQQRDDAIRTLKAVLSMISQRVAFSDESANDQKSLEILRSDCFVARQHIHEFIANAEKEAK